MIGYITDGIKIVLGWTGQILEQTIDWGWVGPSEGICLTLALGLLGIIIGKKSRR